MIQCLVNVVRQDQYKMSKQLLLIIRKEYTIFWLGKYEGKVVPVLN